MSLATAFRTLPDLEVISVGLTDQCFLLVALCGHLEIALGEGGRCPLLRNLVLVSTVRGRLVDPGTLDGTAGHGRGCTGIPRGLRLVLPDQADRR